MSVLVASVGLSPVPVALSIMTLIPDHVILVCSQQSRPEADRIRATVRTRNPEMTFGDYLTVTDAALADLALMRQEILEGLPDLLRVASGSSEPREYMLAYTGGSSEMVCALVDHHLRHHGKNRGDLRFYVDLGNSVLRRDSGSAVNRVREFRLSSVLTVRERAALNGYELSGRERGSAALPPTGDIVRWQDEGDVYEENVRDFRECFGAFHPPPAAAADRYADTATVVEGDGSEAQVLSACSGLVSALRAASTAAAGPSDIELWWGCRPFQPGEKNPVCELDAVLRVGNRIVVVEVKKTDNSHDERAVWEFAASVAKNALRGREAFGNSVEYFFWALGRAPAPKTGGRAPTDYSEEFTALLELSSSAIRMEANRNLVRRVPRQDREAALQDFQLSLRAKVDGHLSAGAGYEGFTQEAPSAGTNATDRGPEPDFRPLQGAAPSIISGVGGSPLPVFAIDHLTLDDLAIARVGPLSAQGQALHPVLKIDVALPLETDLYDADRLESILESMMPAPSGPVGFYATPATKAVTAAMTATAFKHAGQRPVDILTFNAARSRMYGASGTAYALDAQGIEWIPFVETALRQNAGAPPGTEVPVTYSALDGGAANQVRQGQDPPAGDHQGVLQGQLSALLRRIRKAGYTVLGREPGHFTRLHAAFPLYILCGAYRVITVMDPALLGPPENFCPPRPERNQDAARKRQDAAVRVHQFVTANLFGEAAMPLLLSSAHKGYLPAPEKTTMAAAAQMRVRIEQSGDPRHPARWTCPRLNLSPRDLTEFIRFLGPVPEPLKGTP